MADVLEKKRVILQLTPQVAECFDLTQVGMMTRINRPGSGEIQYQVIELDNSGVKVLAQRVEDIDSGRFALNSAFKHDTPWKELPLIASGGEGKIFGLNDSVLKVGGSTRSELLELLRLRGIDGVIKLKGMYQIQRDLWVLILEQLVNRDLELVTPAEFREIARNLFRTVEEIERRGLKHGDISPSNIMFRGDRPVLIDVGGKGITRGYSDQGNDYVALALSLIDMRLDRLFLDEFLDLYTQVEEMMYPLALLVKTQRPGTELKEIHHELIYEFLNQGNEYKPMNLNLPNIGREEIRKWAGNGSLTLAIITEGLKHNLRHFQELNQLDQATFERVWQEGLGEIVEGMGYMGLSSRVERAFKGI